MERIPQTPPVIQPLHNQEERPRWSVMIPVYNCARFLPETLRSVLQQDISREQMQIQVVDDASTDADVGRIVHEVGKGRIEYFRQKDNVGSLRNFETCINRSRGEYVHLLHGDDKVKKGYYNAIGSLFNNYPEIGAAFCGFEYIDENDQIIKDAIIRAILPNPGILDDWLMKISEQQYIQYATITVKREVYEKLGSFFGVTYAEDWEMWVRIAKHYRVAYTPEKLALYRRRNDSISTDKLLNAQFLQDTEKAIENFRIHLPLKYQKIQTTKAKKRFARYGLRIANELWMETKNGAATRKNLKQIIKMNKSFKVVAQAVKLYILTLMK